MEKGCALHERRPNTELYVITSASFNKIRLPSQQQHPVCYPYVNATKLKLGKGEFLVNESAFTHAWVLGKG